VRRVLWLQAMLGAAAAAGAYPIGGGHASLAVLYGAAVALVNAGVLAWHIRRGGRTSSGDASRELRGILAAGFQRLAVVVALLAAGFGILGLMPLALLTGFIVGQLGLLLSGLLGDGV
jgi:hypothetical protein